MARMTLDIHNYQKNFNDAGRLIQHSELSGRNKTLILGYRDACLVKNVCGRVRLIRVLGVLLLFGRMLTKDFDTLTREDVEHLLSQLLLRQPPYSPETLSTYKIMLRSFLTWLAHPDEFPKATPPANAAWINTTLRSRDKRRLERKDLLTPDDIDRLIKASLNPRDKAFISILWETGGRVAEIGNLQIRQVTRVEHGYTLDVTGKTGGRSPIVISSAPLLTIWLNNHPFRDRPDSPLWVHYQSSNEPRHITYATIQRMLIRTFARAGITKPCHPHIFRHSRATYCLANGIMNEQQAKSYFGWTPDSNMLAIYSHLVDQDANNAILRENDLAPTRRSVDQLRPIKCRICQELNLPDADYCTKCNAVLNLTKAYEHQTLHNLQEDLFANVFKILVQKGLVDEAAREIHDANLGETLRRLAQHTTEQAPVTTTRTSPTGSAALPPETSLRPSPEIPLSTEAP